MPTAPAIDIEALLAPIEGENPAGADIRSTTIIGELQNLRKSDDADNLGDWAPKEVKTASWPKSIKLAIDCLTTKSKNLDVAVFLCEALVNVHGLAGLRDGLRLVREMHLRYWDNMYPTIQKPQPAEGEEFDDYDDDNPLDVRAAAVAKIDGWVPAPVNFIKVTKPTPGSTALTMADWKKANHLDNLARMGDDASKKAYDEEIAEGKPTGEVFRKAVAGSPLTFYKNLVEDLDACLEEQTQLNQLLEERYYDAEDPPRLTKVGEILTDVDTLVSDIEKTVGKLREKPEEAAEGGEAVAEGEEGGMVVQGTRVAFTGPGIPTNPVDRNDAVRRLQAVAQYFRQAEPHSPVTYLVDRAVHWASMPLDKWLEEVIKDPAVLGQIKETLGLGAADAAASE